MFGWVVVEAVGGGCMRRHSLLAAGWMLYCVLSGSEGTGRRVRHCEFYLIPQDNVLKLISRMLQRERETLDVEPYLINLPKHVRQSRGLWAKSCPPTSLVAAQPHSNTAA